MSRPASGVACHGLTPRPANSFASLRAFARRGVRQREPCLVGINRRHRDEERARTAGDGKRSRSIGHANACVRPLPSWPWRSGSCLRSGTRTHDVRSALRRSAREGREVAREMEPRRNRHCRRVRGRSRPGTSAMGPRRSWRRVADASDDDTSSFHPRRTRTPTRYRHRRRHPIPTAPTDSPATNREYARRVSELEIKVYYEDTDCLASFTTRTTRTSSAHEMINALGVHRRMERRRVLVRRF